jgi:histone H3/H4
MKPLVYTSTTEITYDHIIKEAYFCAQICGRDTITMRDIKLALRIKGLSF